MRVNRSKLHRMIGAATVAVILCPLVADGQNQAPGDVERAAELAVHQHRVVNAAIGELQELLGTELRGGWALVHVVSATTGHVLVVFKRSDGERGTA